MRKIVLGVDIGGSHITSALIDVAAKVEVGESWSRTAINANGTANEIMNAWATSLEKSIAGYPQKPSKISIAMPGPMDYPKGICKIKDQDKYRALYNLNIKEMLANRLAFNSSDINFMNDAACFLKGEIFSGSLTGFEKAIGLTLGTGLGTSYFNGGKAIDADLWKMPFLDGIAEDYISTRWFIKRFNELSGEKIIGVKELLTHYESSPHVKAIFKEFSFNLATFIYRFAQKKMPLAAVIGGNIALASAYFIEETSKYLSDMMGYSFPLRKSALGEKAALLGAGSSF